MSDAPVPVERIDLGVIDGCHVWEVRRTDTGEIIGYDQKPHFEEEERLGNMENDDDY